MLNDTSLFKDDILNTFIIHLPHTSFNLPDNNFLISGDDLQRELLLSTDVEVDKIFNIPQIQNHVCHFSRLFCDVEKLLKYEPYDIKGRGILYTKTIDDRDLRDFNQSIYWDIITQYYIPYHNEIYEKVSTILKNNGVVRIIDAHSFNGFDTNIDFSIGTDNFHTPKYLSDFVINFLKNKGFNVVTNKPYSGTYVPMPFFNIDVDVHSVMIEINKKLYCNINGNPINTLVNELNGLMKEMFNSL